MRLLSLSGVESVIDVDASLTLWEAPYTPRYAIRYTVYPKDKFCRCASAWRSVRRGCGPVFSCLARRAMLQGLGSG